LKLSKAKNERRKPLQRRAVSCRDVRCHQSAAPRGTPGSPMRPSHHSQISTLNQHGSSSVHAPSSIMSRHINCNSAIALVHNYHNIKKQK